MGDSTKKKCVRKIFRVGSSRKKTWRDCPRGRAADGSNHRCRQAAQQLRSVEVETCIRFVPPQVQAFAGICFRLSLFPAFCKCTTNGFSIRYRQEGSNGLRLISSATGYRRNQRPANQHEQKTHEGAGAKAAAEPMRARTARTRIVTKGG